MGRVCDGLKRKAREEAVAFKCVGVAVCGSKSTTSGEGESNVGGEQLHHVTGEPLSYGMGEEA